MAANVDIYSGFLGAGKTRLIKTMLSKDYYKNNTVILENEFGEVSIDGMLLNEEGIEVKEVNSGCICCSTNSSFESALMEILDNFNPENLIIEPSGVAKLSSVIDTIEMIKFNERLSLRNVVTVIDANNFEYYLKNFKNFYKDQIRYTHNIFLTRIEDKDKLFINNIKNQILDINENVKIFDGGYKKLNDFEQYGFNERNQKIKKRSKYAKIIKNPEKFQSLRIDINKQISEEEIKKKFYLINNNSYGNIVRAKGIVKNTKNSYFAFDYVHNEFNVKSINYGNRNVISIIGENLNKEGIIKLFK